ERRHAALDVRLDLDAARLEPDEGERDCAREHAATVRVNVCRVCAGSARDQHVFEELAGAPPGAAVDVAPQALLEAEACTLEDLGIEVATVVYDDDERRLARKGLFGVQERGDDAVAIGGERRA